MTDLVERLRKPMIAGFIHPVDTSRREAADEIERLRSIAFDAETEVVRLRKQYAEHFAEANARAEQAEAEIERLRAELANEVDLSAMRLQRIQKDEAEVERLQAHNQKMVTETNVLFLQKNAEIERLRAELANEVYLLEMRKAEAALRAFKD